MFPLKQRYDRENATIDGVVPEFSPDVATELTTADLSGRLVAEDPSVDGPSGPDALGIYFDQAVENISWISVDEDIRSMKLGPVFSGSRVALSLQDRKVCLVRCGHK